MSFLDRKMENWFKKILHKKRKKFIQKAIDHFIAEYHPPEQTIDALREKLELEADRIYAVVDRSILKERIKRAKYTFWITAISSVIIVGVLAAFTGGTIVPVLVPILAAFVAFLVTVGTIPLSYNQRIKGAMDSTVYAFIKTLTQKSAVNFDFNKHQAEINEMRSILITIIQQMNIQTVALSPPVFVPSTQESEFINELSKIKAQLAYIEEKIENMDKKVEMLWEIKTNLFENPKQFGIATEQIERLVSSFTNCLPIQEEEKKRKKHSFTLWDKHKKTKAEMKVSGYCIS